MSALVRTVARIAILPAAISHAAGRAARSLLPFAVTAMLVSACAHEAPVEAPPPPPVPVVVTEAPNPVPTLDSDGDGVPDDRDKCPNTPHGVRVDSDGCPVREAAASQGSSTGAVASTGTGARKLHRAGKLRRLGMPAGSLASAAEAAGLIQVGSALPPETPPAAEPAPVYKDALVLYSDLDKPISVNEAAALTVVASFSLSCEKLAGEMQWDPAKKCAPSPQSGSDSAAPASPVSKILGVDLAHVHFIRAKADCSGKISCKPEGWSAGQDATAPLMRWDWSINAAQDAKGDGELIVHFAGAATIDGEYQDLPNVVPPVKVPFTVLDQGSYWSGRIQGYLKNANAIVLALIALFGSLAALYWKLRGKTPPAEKPAKPD